ncbi:MAG: pseudouridine synthase [Planctomyces sp.]|nr:pseudouridine synthase [Planctomyces sp.]
MNDEDLPLDDSAEASPARIRLQRFLAACGLGSRRACEELITDGRVTVDGVTVDQLGATVDPSAQKILLDGERLRMERKRYYALNKPPGYLCTARDPAGRRRVLDLMPPGGPRMFTVGRLDENSTGLIFVTNDGDLAEKLAHPRNQIFRTYHVQVAGVPTREVYESLKEGLHFSDGRFRVRTVKTLKKVGQSAWLEVVLSEGHNRELRRLFARVGHKVLKLTRMAFGPIRLGRLNMGEFRPLTVRELADLHGMVERGGEARRAPRKPGGRRPADKGPGRSPGKRPGKRPAKQPGGRAGANPSGGFRKPAGRPGGGPRKKPSRRPRR